MQPARHDLRPLGAGEAVGSAIGLYQSNFLTLTGIAAAIIVPVSLLQYLVTRVMVGDVDPGADLETALWAFLQALLVLMVVTLLATVLVQAASITALAQVYLGRKPSRAESLRAGARQFAPLLLYVALIAAANIVGLLAFLVVFDLAGLVLFLVPAAAFMVRLSAAAPALVVERLGPIEAARRSWRLTAGRFWPVLGAVALAYLFVFIVNQIVGSIAERVVLDITSAPLADLVFVALIALGSILTTPFLAAVVTVVYVDLRVRKEGFDLERLAADLAPDG